MCALLVLRSVMATPATKNDVKNISDKLDKCGSQKMAPHVNKWSPLDGAHKLQVTVIVTTSELS